MTMERLAQHIIGVAHAHGKLITNLQLQKVMYFTLQYALKSNILSREQITQIYDNPFLVWRYGPVEKDTYEKYRVYGSYPITENDKPYFQYNNLNNVIIELLNKNVFDLVNKSHKEKFWKLHSSQIQGWRSSVPYSVDDIYKG